MELLMRNATIQDSQLLLEWRNDDHARRYSHSRVGVPEEEHRQWLNDRLKLISHEPFWIFENELKVIGVVRLDFESLHQHFRISILINPLMRGEGYGKIILNRTISNLEAQNPNTSLYAEIHRDNLVSQKLFTKCGFDRFESDTEFLVFKRITNLQ